LFRNFTIGGTGGVYRVHTGPGKRSGIPSTDEVFDPTEIPGLNENTWFLRWGVLAKYDYRDDRNGASAGGVYGVQWHKYSDRDRGEFNFRQLEGELQQFIPYFNKTRVIALRAMAVLSFTDDGQRVPMYAQPILGGNDYLRGFQRQRFYDDNAILATVEHRWQASEGVEPAIFVDAGKVTANRSDLDFSDLDWSVGFGVRLRIKSAVVMRIDVAASDEGVRFMWTFNDIFRIR
ncbi:unnamed protein product, partial [marine sediment metagenome]